VPPARVVCCCCLEAVPVPPARIHLSALRLKIRIFQKKYMELPDWSFNTTISRTVVICINNVAECVVMSCERTEVTSN
jgi:hypothetical protein